MHLNFYVFKIWGTLLLFGKKLIKILKLLNILIVIPPIKLYWGVINYEKINIRNIFIIWILGFSRYIEHCKVIENDTCISLKSGKRFNFSGHPFASAAYGSVYRVYFEGNGYKNLYFTGNEYLYN